jgi:hypothetical protein
MYGRVTSDELMLRRFGAIVILFLTIVSLSEAAIKAELQLWTPNVNHMQYSDVNTRLQCEILEVLRREL